MCARNQELGERHASACRYKNEIPEGSRRYARRTHFLSRDDDFCQAKQKTIDGVTTVWYDFGMISSVALTEADILGEVVESNRSTLSRQVAEEFLSLRFNDTATERIRELLQQNNAGSISDVEKSTLDNYLRVGEFLDLLQANARVSLLQDDSAA